MNIGLEQYSCRDSLLHRWNAKDKLLGLGALILSFSAVRQLELLPAMVAVTLVFFIASRLPLQLWRDRLKLPGFFLISMLLWLPFNGETAIAQLGPWAIYSEGLQSLLLLGTRFVCILTLGLVLIGTAPFLSLIRALRNWGLPVLLGDMMLLSYRYLYEIGGEFKTMRTAMKLRGFQHSRLDSRTLKILASLAGSLLVRSYEKSERVYSAMRLRGYGSGHGHGTSYGHDSSSGHGPSRSHGKSHSHDTGHNAKRTSAKRQQPRRPDEILLLSATLLLSLVFALSPWLWRGG